jgi:enterochelin esterase-like enzyme
MKSIRLVAFLTAACCAQSAGAQQPLPSQNAGHYERVVVHGPSLEDNLAGDSADRQVSVYLPPGYAKEKRRRYPVLFLLHGFTSSDARWFGLQGQSFVHLPNAVDAAAARGMKPMIVVMPDALNKFQGSMYASSAVIGDWERFVTRDLVNYIDGHYRTLARPESRGLAGHSMGGYGTLRLAMKYPGVFTSLYVMSPCCLDTDPRPPVEFLERAAKLTTREEIAAEDFPAKAMVASAAAWSPNPRKPPLFIDLPLENGKLVPAILIKWSANSPLVMLDQYVPALKGYGALFIDAGDEDLAIAATVRQLHGALESYGITHGYEIYDGDHVNRIQQRLVEKVLPFFSEQLESAKN